MAEQGNTMNPGPQEQENTQQKPAEEPWWMDHVRQLVVGPGRTPPPPPGPPTWALQHIQPTPPPPPLPQTSPQTSPQPTAATPSTTATVEAAEPADQADQEAPTALPEPELKGYTNALPIASILEFLSVNKQSGTLYLTNNEETFSLEILEGDIVHASSDRSGDEQLLGSILVARDNIGTEQLEEFYKRFSPNADPCQSGEPGESGESGDYEELVSREDLKLALEEQVQELFNRLYAADDCSFCFYEGETSGVEQRIRLNVTRLLLESARTLDELERPDPVEPAEAVETHEVAEVEELTTPENPLPAEELPAQEGLGILDQIDEDGIQEPAGEEADETPREAPSEMESFDEAGDFDDTVPFDGVGEYHTMIPSEDMQPLDDTPPFDDTTPFDNVPLDDTPPFDSEEPGEHVDFPEYDESVEMGDEFDELSESEDEVGDQRDTVP